MCNDFGVLQIGKSIIEASVIEESVKEAPIIIEVSVIEVFECTLMVYRLLLSCVHELHILAYISNARPAPGLHQTCSRPGMSLGYVGEIV